MVLSLFTSNKSTMVCSACNKKVDRTDAAKITCSDCKHIFHLKCTNLNLADVEFLRSENKGIRCSNCLSSRRKSMHQSSEALGQNPKNSPAPPGLAGAAGQTSNGETSVTLDQNAKTSSVDVPQVLADAVGQTGNSNTSDIQQPNQQFTSSVSNEMIYAKLTNLERINAEYLTTINQLQNDNLKLVKTVSLLENRVSQLEQNKLSNCIDIVGVSNATNANARELSKKIISETLDVNISDENIINCYVKPARKKNNSNEASSSDGKNANVNKMVTTIFCELSSAYVKKSVLLAKKTKFEDLKKNELYINESLTGHYRTLYNSSKDFKKEKKFKYLWYTNGQFLLRKTDKSKVVVIRSFDDLNKLKNNENINVSEQQK